MSTTSSFNKKEEIGLEGKRENIPTKFWQFLLLLPHRSSQNNQASTTLLDEWTGIQDIILYTPKGNVFLPLSGLKSNPID